MEIQYQNNTTCLQCWSCLKVPPLFYFITETEHLDCKTRISQKSVKLSLKKYKQFHKTRGSSSNRFSCQQTHQKRKISLTRAQQKKAVHRPMYLFQPQRQNSHVTQEKSGKLYLKQMNHKNQEKNITILSNRKSFVAKRRIRLGSTTKSYQYYQSNYQELQQAKKVIQVSMFSLKGLSNMKESDQRAKIQESIIMMDYFNPSSSRIEHLKLIDKSQYDPLKL